MTLSKKTITTFLSVPTALMLSTAIHAESGSRALHIPAGRLSTALNSLAEASDLQMVYDTDVTKGLQSQALNGNYTPAAALQQLLQGSGLSYQLADNGTVTISRQTPSAQPQNTSIPPEAAVLPTVQVKGQAEYATDDPYNTDYNRPNATTATKTDTPIMETPVSIQVVPRAVMDDQQAISVADAVKNVSGVQPGGYTFYDNFILRGFDAGGSTFRNGLRHQSTTSLETANLDRIEVLKGPATVLFGRSEPGGLINLTTKRPLEEAYYSIQQQFGSYDLYRTTIDATGPVLEDRSLLYRMNLAYKDNNTFQDFVSQESIFFAPSVTWRPTEKFETNLDIEYQHNEFVDVSDIGIPAIGNRPAPLPISRLLGDPAAKNRQERILVGLNWTYAFTDDWKLTNRFQYNDAAYNQNTLWANYLDNDMLYRGLWQADMNRTTYATNLDLTGHFHTGIAEHNVLAGFDYYRFEADYSAFAGETPLVPPIDIFNPSYNVNLSSLTRNDYNQFGTFPEQWYGVYFQDQITLWDRLHILGGGRQDWAEIGSSFSDVSLADAIETTTRTDYFSPRVGIVYQPWHWLSVYGNYVESLGSNNSGTPAPGTGSLSPQTAQQWEAGIKTEFFDGKLNSTLAYFDLTKQNTVTRIQGEPFDRTIGEANSEGVELDVSGQLTENLSVIGSYAYTDAKITKDFTGTEGNQLTSVPKNSGSLWAKYAFHDGVLNGLNFGSGIFARSERWAYIDNTAQMPGYVRWDASVSYSFKQLGSKITTQLNVYNLLDKKYYDHANTNLTIQPGMPLTFLGSVRVEF